MLVVDKNTITRMSITEKYNHLIDELQCIKEIVGYHKKDNKYSDYRKSGRDACTWIYEDISGLLELFEKEGGSTNV